ncbi:phytanoyl-CoA dioxygenase family protein [Kiloniella antarctica]|uniref:Phytanoyl-CoA dioxygenase family protein n=1 Tax=Kiloniella antarctica TaxID=1550907 RepID=A0ABW5BIV4_9PROT
MEIIQENFKDLSFWRTLNPELSITNKKLQCDSLSSINEHLLSNVSDTLWRDGYLNCQTLYTEQELLPIRTAMELFHQRQIPQAFIYLYDETWTLFLRARTLLSNFLGDNYQILPHFWAWYIEPGKGKGWPPHRDSADRSVINLYGQEMLVSLSLWLPLTDATPENSCMSLLPLSYERQYNNPITDLSQIPLQDVLCLPAKAGSLLGWRQDLFHWGGKSHASAKSPRLSLSLEFQNAALDPLCEPLFNPEHPPAPEDRLNLILLQFEKYKHIADLPDITSTD